MDNKFPLVSVIITSYNRAQFIGKAIESALMQDYPNLEVIVSDNCSTDNSDAVIRSYLKDNRVKYFKSTTNMGMIPNFQKAIEQLASGDYLTFISSDDFLINKSFISESVELFLKYNKVVIVKAPKATCKDDFIIPNNSNIHFFEKEVVPGKEMFLRFNETNCPIGFSACMIDARALKRVDIAYDPEGITLEHEILLSLLLLGDIAFIKKHSYAFRVHDTQISRIFTTTELLGNLRIIKRLRNTANNLNQFKEGLIDQWYQKAVHDSIRFYYIRKYCKDFDEFDEFIGTVSQIYPQTIDEVNAEGKIKRLKLIYNRHVNFLGALKFTSPRLYKLINEYKSDGLIQKQ